MKPVLSRAIRTSRSPITAVVPLLLGLGLFSSTPTQAVESSPAALDPVVIEVIEMLTVGVDEGVIVKWLESTRRQPADIGSQGIIELTRAGATEYLLTSLFELVEHRGADASDTATQATAPLAMKEERGSTEAVLRLSAKQVWTDEDEPDRPREPPWNIYLYLDGDYVAWTRPTLQGEPVEARRVLVAGRHELRVVLQRYEELRGGWLYESLSVPTLVVFETLPGEPVEIEVEMKRIWGLWRQRQDGGPLSYVIRQGAEALDEHGGTGGDPDRWRPVCEDVEANFPDSEEVPKRFRNVMSRCTRWAELWTGAGRSTSRAEILALLADHDFRPPVR